MLVFATSLNLFEVLKIPIDLKILKNLNIYALISHYYNVQHPFFIPFYKTQISISFYLKSVCNQVIPKVKILKNVYLFFIFHHFFLIYIQMFISYAYKLLEHTHTNTYLNYK